jgi:DHA1 family bicyclomycin/chloramphenicol resistance-like MFS transporter
MQLWDILQELPLRYRFISTIMAVPISIYIGRFIAETALPLFVGFSICAAIN